MPPKIKRVFTDLGAALCMMVVTRIATASAQQNDRSQLPTPDTQYKYPGKIPLDARDAKFPPIKLLGPPAGAPNVVAILLDDIGAPSTFGGGINMPTLDALAKDGLRYTQFHTTALCSPTREALQKLFLAQAEKYNVLPLDDRHVERFVPTLAGRPSLMWGRTSLTLYPGMTALLENSTIDIKNRSHTVTAQIEVPQAGAEGVILAQGALRRLEPLREGWKAQLLL
jgi:hypothetical protein